MSLDSQEFLPIAQMTNHQLLRAEKRAQFQSYSYCIYGEQIANETAFFKDFAFRCQLPFHQNSIFMYPSAGGRTLRPL
jgi:hypothetical protein